MFHHRQHRLCLRSFLLLNSLLLGGCFAAPIAQVPASPAAPTSSSAPAAPSFPSAPGLPLAVMRSGGGFTLAGLRGEYFANPTFNGPVAFTRQDVRLDFDWNGQKPGGSAAEPYRSFPATGYSVRWSGQLLARSSEIYTFFASPGMRVMLKNPSQTQWKTVADALGKSAAQSGTFAFTQGQPVDIKIAYRPTKGASIARLEWASPGTLRQVIEPTANLATNAYGEGLVDAMQSARDEWKTPDFQHDAARDQNGWPKEDASCVVWEGSGGNEGTYAVQFNGQAKLDVQGNLASFQDQHYDPATNTTTAKMVVKPGVQNFVFIVTDTQRDAKSPLHSGVTNIKLIRPMTQGSNTPFPLTTIFNPAYEKVLRHYTALRFMSSTNWNSSVNWSDRTPLTYSTQHMVRGGDSGFEGHGLAWEYRVALANETGKDLYICIPEMANDDYITKLAQLIRYGSDGINPYTAPQANPKYPPLNSNLKVYVEYSNEIWNYAFAQWRQNFDAAQAAVKNGTPEGKIIAFDGNTDGNVDWNRRQALRVVQASNIFRQVWGDGNMGTRVRPLLEWQYANAGWPPTASTELSFVDAYFNNGDGQNHVATPHPVSYFIWGGGGATYYNGNEENGFTTLMPDDSFESVAVKDHETPAGSSWKFSGGAGVAHNDSSLGAPKAADGAQFAFVPGSGSVSTRVTFPKDGVANIYALSFKAVQRKKSGTDKTDEQTLDVYFDDQKITHPNSWQGFLHPNGDWNSYVSEAFTAEPGSTHTLKIVGLSQNPDDTAFLDSVKVSSVDALFAAGIPSTGYEDTLRVECNWARLYGLQPSAYEGGWALGGDAGGTPLQNWAKFNDPRTKEVHRGAIDTFHKAGGNLEAFGTYSQWSGWDNADKEPFIQAIDESNSRLPAAPTNATAVPGELTPANRTAQWGDKNLDADASGHLNTNGWINWNILVPRTGTYTFSVSTSTGGELQLSADDVLLIASGASGSPLSGKVMLPQGLHTLRLKARSGSCNVTGISVKAGSQ